MSSTDPHLPLSAEGKPMIGIVTGATQPRGMDHLVMGVRDLDAAAVFYETLGFQVGARNRHPWGTENRIVQFAGSFLELITVADDTPVPPHVAGHFSFGAFVKSSLLRGEGISMLALESHDAKIDAASFGASGIGDFAPFFFERQGVKPDGSPLRVAFTLAFAHDVAADACGFFVCQQHEPQNFWNPAFQKHPNGAFGLSAVTICAENPSDHHIFLEAFTGLRGPRSSSMGLSFALKRNLGNHETKTLLDVVTPQAAASIFGDPAMATSSDLQKSPRFVSFSVAIPDMAAMAARLEQAGIPALTTGHRLVVPAHAAFGVTIVFENQN